MYNGPMSTSLIRNTTCEHEDGVSGRAQTGLGREKSSETGWTQKVERCGEAGTTYATPYCNLSQNGLLAKTMFAKAGNVHV